MDFQLSEEQTQLQEAARSFAQSELQEFADTCETEASPPPPRLLKRYADLGFL
ncbi:MAG: acyl-CoA dehydrogenase family protein, partial [Sphingomonadales bacterium]